MITDPRLAAPLLVVGLAATAVLLYAWWPAGVLLGAVAGVLAVFRIGVEMQRAAARETVIVVPQQPARQQAAAPAATSAPADEPAVRVSAESATPAASPAVEVAVALGAAPEDGVRGDLDRLKAQLGDVWPDFARAARLVVSTQYASAARLQRELQVPYSRARRILDDLESEHFVGPATGSLPRQVLLPKERLPEVERLFAAA